jgi:hypothetical protein
MRPNILIVFLFLGACSPSDDKGATENAAERFHQLYNAGRMTDIYHEASDSFRRSVSERQLVKTLQLTHQKLGDVKRSRQTNWATNYGTDGRTVLLIYSTDFASGHGDERFVYEVISGTAHLRNYNVKSPLLPN